MRAGCVTYRVLRVVRVIGRAIEGGERCLRRLCGLHPLWFSRAFVLGLFGLLDLSARRMCADSVCCCWRERGCEVSTWMYT